MQVVYASQPFGYDVAALSGILLDARRNNERDNITGALICRRDIYLQLLEGPTSKVQATLDRISRDDRHLAVRVLVSEQVESRLFADWAMLHDPADTLIWTEAELSDGILDRTVSADITEMFGTLARKVKATPLT